MDYWDMRAKSYNNLEWVKNKKLLLDFIKFCDIKWGEKIHEIGAGTGQVAEYIACTFIDVYVLASDYNTKMLEQIKLNKNLNALIYNIQEPLPPNYPSFNRVLARMVFHHVDNLDIAFRNCWNMLKEGGWLIIEESVPPNNTEIVTNWTEKLRNLKEKRNHFNWITLYRYLQNSGFINLIFSTSYDVDCSVKKWLKNSWSKDTNYKKIYNMHLNAPQEVKDSYNMKILEDDILMTYKFLLIKGQK